MRWSMQHPLGCYYMSFRSVMRETSQLAMLRDTETTFAFSDKESDSADAYWAKYVPGIDSCILPSIPDVSKPSKQLCSIEVPLNDIRHKLSQFCENNETSVANFFHAV